VKWDNNRDRPSVAASERKLKEGLVLAHRFPRNPYFHFHPLHAVFSLLGSIILFGLLIWFLAVPAR